MRLWAENILRGLNSFSTNQDDVLYDVIRRVRQQVEKEDVYPLSSREAWKSKCILISKMLVDELKRVGIRSTLLWISDLEKSDLNYSDNSAQGGHCVVKLGNGRILDMTSGQYGFFPMLDMYMPKLKTKRYPGGW